MSQYTTIDRTAEVKALAESYGPIGKAYAAKRFAHKAHLFGINEEVQASKVVLEYTMQARDALSLWAEAAVNPDRQRDMRKECPTNSSTGFENDSWRGILCDDYAKEISGETCLLRERLEKAQAELAGSGLKESLESTMIGKRKRRKRIWSDCEGSFEYDRRQDDMPFSRMVTHKKEFPHIELVYPMAMNSGASAQEITVFSARSLALADILESLGYRVAITAEVWMRRTLGSKDYLKSIPGCEAVQEQVDLVRFPLREASDYGDIAGYAPIAGVEFFRRALFDCHYNQVHHAHGLKEGLGKHPDWAKGQAVDERPLPATEGQVILDMRTINALFSMNKDVRESMFKERFEHTVKAS